MMRIALAFAECNAIDGHLLTFVCRAAPERPPKRASLPKDCPTAMENSIAAGAGQRVAMFGH